MATAGKTMKKKKNLPEEQTEEESARSREEGRP